MGRTGLGVWRRDGVVYGSCFLFRFLLLRFLVFTSSLLLQLFCCFVALLVLVGLCLCLCFCWCTQACNCARVAAVLRPVSHALLPPEAYYLQFVPVNSVNRFLPRPSPIPAPSSTISIKGSSAQEERNETLSSRLPPPGSHPRTSPTTPLGRRPLALRPKHHPSSSVTTATTTIRAQPEPRIRCRSISTTPITATATPTDRCAVVKWEWERDSGKVAAGEE